MNDGPMKAVLVSALIALFVGGSFVALPADAQAQDRAQSLFDEAVKLWRQGDSEGAAKALKDLIAEDASHENAYDLLRKAEYQMFLDLLTEGGESAQVAKAILELAHRGEMERTRDEGAISRLVDQAVHGETYADREKAVRALVARHGEFAVPKLYKYLGSNDTNERVYAILALSELSIDAVLPLVEVLQSDDWRTAQNAALVLQKLDDMRAVGGLAELAASAADASVKEAATQGLMAIYPEAPETAAQVYLDLSKWYYMKDDEVIKNYLGTYTVWDWKDGELTDRQVPRYVYHLELAEEAAYDALALEPGNQDARNMLAAVHYAQAGTMDALSREARADDAVKTAMARYQRVLPITAAQGTDTQLGALALGLEWNDADIALGALHALPATWDGRAIEGTSLAAALEAEAKTVRFGAAIAALAVDPGAPYAGFEMVIPIAAQAADTGSLRQVLLVEPNAEIRARSLKALQDAGLYAVAEATGIGGYRRAKEVGTFDAIVIRADLEDKLALKIVTELREDFRTQDTPILISGDEGQIDQAKALYGPKVGYVSADPIDVEEVRDAARGSMNDDQMRALEVSKAACEALAGLDPAATAYDNYGEAEGALLGVLASNKPDDIRLAALEALAQVGAPSAAEALADAFARTANATSIRVGAADALGSILEAMAAPGKVFDSLLGGFGDEAAEVRAAAGRALGAMKLTPDQQNSVLTAYRVE